MVTPEIVSIRSNESAIDMRRLLAAGEEILLTAGTPDGYDLSAESIAEIHMLRPTEFWTPQSVLAGEMSVDKVSETRDGVSFVGSIGLFQEDIMRYLYRSGIRPVYTLNKPNEAGLVQEIGLTFVGAMDGRDVNIFNHFSEFNSESLEPSLAEIIALSSYETSFKLIPKIA